MRPGRSDITLRRKYTLRVDPESCNMIQRVFVIICLFPLNQAALPLVINTWHFENAANAGDTLTVTTPFIGFE